VSVPLGGHNMKASVISNISGVNNMRNDMMEITD